MVRVKVCGITRKSDAVLLSELGAAAVGFVFWEGSPRVISPEAASDIVSVLSSEVTPVGVFVDPTQDWVCEVLKHVPLGAIQLHGGESIEFCQSLSCPVIKAVSLKTAADIESVTALPENIRVLLDTYDPIVRGGTGRTIDWSIAATAAKQRPVFLAGGLTPENVAEAVKTVKPYGVDASSGLETEPGIKDPRRVRAFFSALEKQ
jgi:phosphoribosylanthranilate isomerase